MATSITPYVANSYQLGLMEPEDPTLVEHAPASALTSTGWNIGDLARKVGDGFKSFLGWGSGNHPIYDFSSAPAFYLSANQGNTNITPWENLSTLDQGTWFDRMNAAKALELADNANFMNNLGFGLKALGTGFDIFQGLRNYNLTKNFMRDQIAGAKAAYESNRQIAEDQRADVRAARNAAVGNSNGSYFHSYTKDLPSWK